MKKTMSEYMSDSHTSGGHLSYLEDLYESYLQDPNSVSEEWKTYFNDLPFQNGTNKDSSHHDVIKYFQNVSRKEAPKTTTASKDASPLEAKVQTLIKAFRDYGHTAADLDPLGIAEKVIHSDLYKTESLFNKEELLDEINCDFPIGSNRNHVLGSLIRELKDTYCKNIGIEFQHISNKRERSWIIEKFENADHKISDQERKKEILKRLISARGLAQFLSSKYPGMKRFGIDGCESLIPLVDTLIKTTSKNGAEQICFGMAHRGRLNLLVNVLGKVSKELFAAFEEDFDLKGSSTGDVKYHLGYSSNIRTDHGDVHVSLTNNPSHLEIVNPVVVGSVRARQDRLGDTFKNRVVPILIHGDAAFSGQGVVMETLQMSQTRAYGVGGTIHVVVNNQIGFTTSHARDARSTRYSTDISKFIEAPVIHVNADDPEAVVFVAELACEYRENFKKDIVIDLVCYRRSGHNEADDPSSTQPVMYKAIKNHNTVLEMYENNLIDDSVISAEEIKDFKKSYRKRIENGESVTPNLAPRSNDDQWFDWEPFMNKKWYENVITSVSRKEIESNAMSIVKTPENFEVQRKVQKIFDERLKMSKGEIKLNWGFAEMMAYSSLLKEGYPIRFTGQDVRRGTFDHRHAVIFDQENGEGFLSLNSIAEKGKTIVDIYDSLLSEEAVLGFEYGYASTWPSGLVIWEAQFGDFVNGAQVVIDQFIVSAEHKWERLSGLVMLLPHGFEGMGPEHSSARLERFLQLCAANNIQVCMPSSPAQIFHLLRRQAIRKMRRPLVVITPKSLLRLPEAASDLSELTDGTFNCIIDDDLPKEDIKRVVLCSGKVFYDLKKARDENGITDIALLRLEQLYPFPYFEVEEMLKDYSHVKDFVWAQEEPQNQGAWFSHRHRLERVLKKLKLDTSFVPISRPPSAAPAVGLMKLHLQQQQELVDNVLCRDNK